MPTFKYTDRVINSTGALALKEVPKKLVVIGGGYIGTELGTAYANFGTEVVILEGGDEILPGFEKQMSSLVKRNLKKKETLKSIQTLLQKALKKNLMVSLLRSK